MGVLGLNYGRREFKRKTTYRKTDKLLELSRKIGKLVVLKYCGFYKRIDHVLIAKSTVLEPLKNQNPTGKFQIITTDKIFTQDF